MLEEEVDPLRHIVFVVFVFFDCVLEDAVDKLADPGDWVQLGQVVVRKQVGFEGVHETVDKQVEQPGFSQHLLSKLVWEPLAFKRVLVVLTIDFQHPVNDASQ